MERHPTIVCATCPELGAFSEKQKERGCRGGQCHKHYQHVEFSEDVCCTDHPEWNREDAQNDRQTIVAQSEQISKLGKQIADLEAENVKLREALNVYGYHNVDCERQEEEKGCTCGWASFKAALGKGGGG